MSEEIKACVGCKHMGETPAEGYNPHPSPHGFVQQVNKGPECRHAKAATKDLVFGRAFCVNERNATKGCGKKGKLWEAKTAGS